MDGSLAAVMMARAAARSEGGRRIEIDVEERVDRPRLRQLRVAPLLRPRGRRRGLGGGDEHDACQRWAGVTTDGEGCAPRARGGAG